MQVYVVMFTIPFEGSDILKIFKSKDLAIKYIMDTKTDDYQFEHRFDFWLNPLSRNNYSIDVWNVEE